MASKVDSGGEEKEADTLFARLDTNTDGFLSADEISKGLRDANGREQEPAPPAGGNRTDLDPAAAWVEVTSLLIGGGLVDTSGDGSISTEEFVAFFDQSDSDDYKVSQPEFVSGIESLLIFNRLDTDKDSILDVTEISKGVSSVSDAGESGSAKDWAFVVDVLTGCGDADTSKDGIISSEEFIAFFDTNADYGVTELEFTGAFEVCIGKVAAAPVADNDDANSAADEGDDAAPPSASKSKAGTIVAIIFAVVILVIAAVAVYIYYLSVTKGNAGIPHTSTMSGGNSRGVANPMYAGVAGGGGGSRTVNSVSNRMYSAPVNAAGVLYAIPMEDDVEASNGGTAVVINESYEYLQVGSNQTYQTSSSGV